MHPHLPHQLPPIEHAILIRARPAAVWKHLTEIPLMLQWIGEPEMNINVTTDWTHGSAILISGFHHTAFEVKGKVLRYDFPEALSYSHLSSVSRLPDTEENYTVIAFTLRPSGDQTELRVTLQNFPTDSIYRHLAFYWPATIRLIREKVEQAPDEQ